MALLVTTYNIVPDKWDAYLKWATESAIPRIMKIPGLVQFRAYRPVTGPYQVATIYEFADMAACAAWLSHADYQAIMAEFRPFVSSQQADVWGPSPVVPTALRP